MSNEHDPSSCTVKAVVVKVEDSYVVTYPVKDYGDLLESDSVTFSLRDWEGASDPEHGLVVYLDETYLYRRGWRANLHVQ